MLEICLPALCAHEPRVPRRSHGHPWLHSFRREATAVRYGVTSTVSVTPGVVDSSASRATYLESCRCRNLYGTGVESYSCEKSRGGLPHNRATQRFRVAKLLKTGFTTTRFAARPQSQPGGIWTREVVQRSPLESALAEKWGRGVPPPDGFLR